MWEEKFDRADTIVVGDQLTYNGEWSTITAIDPSTEAEDYLIFSHTAGSPLNYKINRRVPYRHWTE